MPHTFTRTFRIRHYECDAYGHLNNANYLRYMQETAFDASAAAGYDLERYNQIGHHWLIRATDIEYLRPLHYGDQVEVKTWVADFHRVRSRRIYEFRLLGTDVLVAHAGTDWVYLESVSGKPATIPQELQEAFFPEGLPKDKPEHHPFPVAPEPPAGIFKMRRQVAWHDIDMAQHVNNAVYLEYAEECGMQVIAAYSWPVQRMTSEGFAIILRRHQIEYRQPALLDEEIEIATWASNVRRSTATRHYTIRRMKDGELLAQIHTLGVWVDFATGRPIRIPDHFIADFAPNIVSNGQNEHA